VKTLLSIVFLLTLASALLLYLKRQALLERKGTGPWPFYVKKPLSQPEQILYHRLVKHCPTTSCWHKYRFHASWA